MPVVRQPVRAKTALIESVLQAGVPYARMQRPWACATAGIAAASATAALPASANAVSETVKRRGKNDSGRAMAFLDGGFRILCIGTAADDCNRPPWWRRWR